MSYYAGLRAKEIAALTVGDVYDEQGSVREQFMLDAVQTDVLAVTVAPDVMFAVSTLTTVAPAGIVKAATCVTLSVSVPAPPSIASSGVKVTLLTTKFGCLNSISTRIRSTILRLNPLPCCRFFSKG